VRSCFAFSIASRLRATHEARRIAANIAKLPELAFNTDIASA
jgi:hypothetical protein